MDHNLFRLLCYMRNALLAMRAAALYVDSKEFRSAWEHATGEQQAELTQRLHAFDKPGAQKLVKSILSSMTLEAKTVKDLRTMASLMGVSYVGEMSKAELICSINQREVITQPIVPGKD